MTPGQQFGFWTVLAAGYGNPLCICGCGTVRNVHKPDLTRGRSRSCGCLKDAATSSRSRTHGETRKGQRRGSKEYQAWRSMRARCRNPKLPRFPLYGGRGIKVCERWQSFEAFLHDVGRAPSRAHSLDRIDNDGNYEPGNVRWATDTEQCRNMRTTVILTGHGRTQPLQVWAEELGVRPGTLRSRWIAWKRLGADGDHSGFLRRRVPIGGNRRTFTP